MASQAGLGAGIFGRDDYLLRANGPGLPKRGTRNDALALRAEGRKVESANKLAFILEDTRKRASYSQGRFVLQLAFRRSESVCCRLLLYDARQSLQVEDLK